MATPTKLRVERKPNTKEIQVRMLLSHAMESGQRKDPQGAYISAWYIQNIVVRNAVGKVLFNAQLGPSVARNPFFEFLLTDLAEGENLEVVWRDNRGTIGRDVFTV